MTLTHLAARLTALEREIAALKAKRAPAPTSSKDWLLSLGEKNPTRESRAPHEKAACYGRQYRYSFIDIPKKHAAKLARLRRQYRAIIK